MIEFVDKNRYRDLISDCERAFLLRIDEEGNIWLKADIEIVGEPQCERVELMDFQIDKEKSILLAIVECRGFYCGGITFIEYDDNNDILELALDDFMNTQDNARYLICDDSDLSNIALLDYNQHLYVYVR